MRVLVTGGGTGGHIYPALTVWHYIKSLHPDAEVLYIGSEQGLEREIVPRSHIPFSTIPAAGLRRELSVKAAKTAWTTLRGYRSAKQLVRQFRPDVVLGTGGYVTLPVIYAAAGLDIPSVIWEANARPGLTNQLCARKAAAVAVCFAGGEHYFPKGTRLVLTGNPRGSEVKGVSGEAIADARARYHIRPEQKLVVGYMGSRGAETVNEVVQAVIPRFAEKPGWQLIYVTGSVHYDNFMTTVGKLPHNVQVLPFLHDMPSVLHSASAVLTRAGGATLAEICSLGLASVLVPSPYVTANHQEENALRLVEADATVMLREQELSANRLFETLEEVLDGPQGEILRVQAQTLARDGAVKDIYDLLMEVQSKRP